MLVHLGSLPLLQYCTLTISEASIRLTISYLHHTHKKTASILWSILVISAISFPGGLRLHAERMKPVRSACGSIITIAMLSVLQKVSVSVNVPAVFYRLWVGNRNSLVFTYGITLHNVLLKFSNTVNETSREVTNNAGSLSAFSSHNSLQFSVNLNERIVGIRIPSQANP